MLGCLALAPAPARADVLHLVSGGKIEGKIVQQDAQFYYVKLRTGTQKVAKHTVFRVEPCKCNWEVYEERRKGLIGKKDPAARADLARWCEANGLPEDAKTEWKEVVKIASDHEEARGKLGFVRHGGKWVTPAEKEKLEHEARARLTEAEATARGLVRHGDNWVTPEEKRELEMKEKGLVKLGDEWVTPEEAKNRADERVAGRISTERLDSEGELGVIFDKRVTWGSVVASAVSADEAKELASLVVKVEEAVRATLPAPERGGPFPGERIGVYSLPKSDLMETFLQRVCRPGGADSDEALNSIRAFGSWTNTGKRPFVFVERREGEGVAEGTNGSLVAHGLAHILLHQISRQGQQKLPAWLDEGYSCGVDGAVLPKSESWCVPDDKRAPFETREKWGADFTNIVKAGQDPPLSELVKRTTLESLEGAFQPKAVAIVRHLAATYPDKFWKLVPVLNALDAETAFRQILGKGLDAVDAEFRAAASR